MQREAVSLGFAHFVAGPTCLGFLATEWVSVQSVAMAAWVQAGAAIVIALLTFKLARITANYARATERALSLSREQFEREWRPDLRIASIRRVGDSEVHVMVVNLARPPALITALRIGTGGGAQQDIETYRRSELVPGAALQDSRIDAELGKYRMKYSPITAPRTRQSWQSRIGISFEYDCAGEKSQTVWFDCVVWFQDIQVTGVEAQ